LRLEPDIPRNVRLARWLLFRLLSGIREGSLTVREGAQTFHFGETSSALHADVQILTPGVYWRVLTGGPCAAEAWMDGEWETTLTPLLQILALNGEVLGRLEKGFRLLGRPLERLRHWTRRNSRAQARENIAAHYDLGNTFYAHFLDDELLYSSALFTATSRISRPSRPKWRACATSWRLARRSPAGNRHRLGAMAEYAARHYGCRVTTTTLSQEQYAGQPSGSPAPGCRIALRCCSATIATSPGSTTSWSRWR
jgi:cyclopropane-fatty-acyl-phospholipid synthase